MQISDEGRERRIVHAVRIDEIGVIGNLHASNAAPAVVLPELERARAFVDGLAGRDEARILAGDFNVAHPALAGYDEGGTGIDHILVADAAAEAAASATRAAHRRRTRPLRSRAGRAARRPLSRAPGQVPSLTTIMNTTIHSSTSSMRE